MKRRSFLRGLFSLPLAALLPSFLKAEKPSCTALKPADIDQLNQLILNERNYPMYVVNRKAWDHSLDSLQYTVRPFNMRPWDQTFKVNLVGDDLEIEQVP